MSGLEELTKIPIAKKAALLAVFVGLIGAAFYFLFYTDLSAELEQLKATHISLQAQYKEAQRSKQTYDEDRKKRDKLKETLALQLRALPADAEISSFLNNLNTQAELVGLEIQSVTPKDETLAEYYARIPVELFLRGTFHQLAKMFYLVGNLDRIINIENITLRTLRMEEIGVILEAQVMATTFRSVADTKAPPQKADK